MEISISLTPKDQNKLEKLKNIFGTDTIEDALIMLIRTYRPQPEIDLESIYPSKYIDISKIRGIKTGSSRRLFDPNQNNKRDRPRFNPLDFFDK